ncbi:MAG: DUF4652 domain-containing protein [bacterium]
MPLKRLYITRVIIIVAVTFITIITAYLIVRHQMNRNHSRETDIPSPPVFTPPDEPAIQIKWPRSKEIKNPSGKYVAYIEPFQWEICGSIFIKNLKTGTTKQLTDYGISRSSKPKGIQWFNDTLMLVIEGYTWGTVTVGGSLYFVNCRTGEYSLILKPPMGQEVAEVSLHKNSVILRVATWNENRMEYTLSTRVLDADSLFRHTFNVK